MVKNLKKELLGYVGVDSGQIIITDPCYLDGWTANDFQDVRVYREIKNGRLWWFGRDFQNYDQKLDNGRTMNQMVIAKEVVDISDTYHKIFDYSYNGACNRTIYDPRQGGEIGSGEQGVVSCTGWGDGQYPVYAYYSKEGRVRKLEIVFMEEDE